MMKAKEVPKVEVSYLTPERPKTPLVFVKKVEEVIPEPVEIPAIPEKRPYIEPELNWAALRCEFDPCQNLTETRPIEDLPKPSKAKISFEKSILDSKFR